MMLDKASENMSFTKCIITGDESWVAEYDVESVQLSSEWQS